MAEKSQEYMDATKAGSVIGVTRQRVHQLMDANRLPHKHVGTAGVKNLRIIHIDDALAYKRELERGDAVGVN